MIGTLSASDQDKQTLTYTLDDDDNGRFSVIKNSLTVSSTNYEKQRLHNVTVRVTDSGSPRLWTTKTFTVQVLDVNEKPVKVTVKSCGSGCEKYSDGRPRVKENSGIGTAVGTVEAHDFDFSQTMALTLTDDADGLFRISSSVTCVSPNILKVLRC